MTRVTNKETENTTSAVLQEDVLLFARFLDGDDAAMMDLYDRHSNRIYLYCLKILGNEQHAEDVTQELWERIIKLRQNPQEVRNPKGLLLKIARNLCLNHIKAQRRHSDLNELTDSDHPASYPRELSHLEEIVVLSLPKLPFAQREVLILNAYSGYRFDEIAEMLGESVGAVRMRASRARGHLGKIISAMLGLKEDHEEENEVERNLRPGGLL